MPAKRILFLGIVGGILFVISFWLLSEVNKTPSNPTAVRCRTESTSQALIDSYSLAQQHWLWLYSAPRMQLLGTTKLILGNIYINRQNGNSGDSRMLTVDLYSTAGRETLKIGDTSTSLLEGYELQILSIEYCLGRGNNHVHYGLAEITGDY